MQAINSPEIYWLTLTTLMTGLLWLPYIANQLIVMGPWRAVSNSDPEGCSAPTGPNAPPPDTETPSKIWSFLHRLQSRYMFPG